jgi:hypothetical protein
LWLPKPAPYRVVAIDRDWVTDTHILYRPPDVVTIVLERELGYVRRSLPAPRPEYFAAQART